MKDQEHRRWLRICASPCLAAALAWFCISCHSYRYADHQEWADRRVLLGSPETNLVGEFENESLEGRLPCLWDELTGRPSRVGDTVAIRVDRSRRRLQAELRRDGKTLDQASVRYRAEDRYLDLGTRSEGHMEGFPLVYGVETAELAVGRNTAGLAMYSVYSGSGFILLVIPAGGGGGPGGGLTYPAAGQ